MVKISKSRNGRTSYLELSNIQKGIGKKVKKFRIKKRISQREFAKEFLIDRSYLNEIEKGKGNPTIGTLHKIATKLRVRISDFI